MLAGGVNVVGSGHYHCVDLRRFRHSPPVVEGLGSVFPSQTRGAVGQGVGYEDKLRAGCVGYKSGSRRPHASGSDQTDFHIRSKNS